MSKNRDKINIGVIGSGPAALLSALALAHDEANVTCIAPTPNNSWKNTYAMWEHEAHSIGFSKFIEKQWSEVIIGNVRSQFVVAKTPYVVLDTLKLQQSLLNDCENAAISFENNKVISLSSNSTHALATLDNGAIKNFDLIINCSGTQNGSLINHAPRAFQVAFGLMIEVKKHDFHCNQMTLIDYSNPTELNSFAYVMPYSKNLLFIEETILAHNDYSVLDTLKGILTYRLKNTNIDDYKIISTEKCIIPLGIKSPITDDRIISIGASAGMVNPTTGYSLAFVARAIARMKEIYVTFQHIEHIALAKKLKFSLWPLQHRLNFRLYDAGLNVLLKLDARELEQFFHAFFSQPINQWMPFITAQGSTKQITKAMLGTFWRLPSSLRNKLVNILIFHKT